MADDTTLPSGSGGDTLRTLEDSGGIKWPAGVCAYVTTLGTPDTLQVVQLTTGLPVQQQTGATFAVSMTTLPAGTNNIGDVDVLTVPADPFGANADAAATAGSTGSIQAKLRLMTSQMDSVKTAVETLDNAISGSEMQVDVVGALPAGSNAIGKLAANSGVDIGDVDVTSVVPGTGVTNLGKAEDAAHSSGDVGIFALTVRRDSAASTADTDGDYAALTTDSTGRLWVAIGNTVTVTGTVTVAQATAANLNMTEASAAAIKAAVEIMDDWDETNRCAVNLIPGQAGVAAGAGAVDATTQRMTLASDDPAVASLSVLDDWDETNRAAVNTIAGQVGVQGGSGTTNALTQRVVLATDVALPAGTNAIGGTVPTASASGTGTDTVFSNAATSTAAAIKASSGRLYALEVSNPNAVDVFVQLFDLATGSVTVGTTTPKLSFLVPAGTDSTHRGAFDKLWDVPIAFATAITYAVTTTPTGSTAPSSNCTLNAIYK